MPLSPPSKNNIQAHILAGGRASRMQGVDKGLLELAGMPLVKHVIDRLLTQVSSICISANRHLEEYQEFGWPVIRDNQEGFLGPLAGIHTALLASECEWLLTVPVDSPFIPEDLLQRLSESVIAHDTRLAVVHDGKGLQPTFCLLHQSLAENLQHYLQQGGRKTGEWLRQQDPALTDYADHPDAFTNINTSEDLTLAEQQLRHAG